MSAIFLCPRCEFQCEFPAFRTLLVCDDIAPDNPGVLRTRRCEECNFTAETFEFMLPPDWKRVPAYQPPPIPRTKIWRKITGGRKLKVRRQRTGKGVGR